MTHDQALRSVLALMAFTALILGGAVIGPLWSRRRWPLRLVSLGCLLLLVYVLAGQVKAFLLTIPFDWFSWLGVLAYAVLIAGAATSIHHERRGR